MPAIYTGARVYFLDYGFSAPADLYAVGDAAVVIRWNVEGKRYGRLDDTTGVTHRVVIGDDFHRPDLGMTVVRRSGFDGPIERKP